MLLCGRATYNAKGHARLVFLFFYGRNSGFAYRQLEQALFLSTNQRASEMKPVLAL